MIPFYNEALCVDFVCEELYRAMTDTFEAPIWEAILVDDGSHDGTGPMIDAWARRAHPFRAIHIHPNSGQSAALAAGFRAARGTYVGTMDGDGQNDPRDLPTLLQELQQRDLGMICGIRAHRADGIVRRFSSRVANYVRRGILHDGITDVGCAMRVFRRDCLVRVPFFRNAHRFFPALVQAAGHKVAETAVHHRPRYQGDSKYGIGINNRLWVGMADLAGVCWLTRRALRFRDEETLAD